MLKLAQLPKKSRRRNVALLREVSARPNGKYVRGEHLFRIAERLHRAGLIDAHASRWSWGIGKRPFRELQLTLPGAPSDYPRMPR